MFARDVFAESIRYLKAVPWIKVLVRQGILMTKTRHNFVQNEEVVGVTI